MAPFTRAFPLLQSAIDDSLLRRGEGGRHLSALTRVAFRHSAQNATWIEPLNLQPYILA